MPDSNTVATTRLTVGNLRLEVATRSSFRGLEDFAGRSGHLMISIKNRLFTAALIDAFCRFCKHHFAHAYVTVVDKPYIHNVMAFGHEPAEADRMLAGIVKLGADRTRQAEKVLRRYPPDRVSFMSWDDLVDAVPAWINEEVEAAFHLGGRFRAALSAQCRQIATAYGKVAHPNRLEFFLLEEMPVLIYAYYLLDGGVVDFYPDDLPAFFWYLERGGFIEELPQTTALAQGHPGLTYVNTALVEKASKLSS